MLNVAARLQLRVIPVAIGVLIGLATSRAAVGYIIPNYHFRFDIGANGSPVEPGWTRLDAAEQEVTSGGVTVRARVQSEDGYRVRSSGDALERDFAFADGAGEEVEVWIDGLPKSSLPVDINVLTGDPAHDALPIRIYFSQGTEDSPVRIVGAVNRRTAWTSPLKTMVRGDTPLRVIVREANSANRSRINAVSVRERVPPLPDPETAFATPGDIVTLEARIGDDADSTLKQVQLKRFHRWLAPDLSPLPNPEQKPPPIAPVVTAEINVKGSERVLIQWDTAGALPGVYEGRLEVIDSDGLRAPYIPGDRPIFVIVDPTLAPDAGANGSIRALNRTSRCETGWSALIDGVTHIEGHDNGYIQGDSVTETLDGVRFNTDENNMYLTWGATNGSDAIQIDPAQQTLHLFSSFETLALSENPMLGNAKSPDTYDGWGLREHVVQFEVQVPAQLSATIFVNRLEHRLSDIPPVATISLHDASDLPVLDRQLPTGGTSISQPIAPGTYTLRLRSSASISSTRMDGDTSHCLARWEALISVREEIRVAP